MFFVFLQDNYAQNNFYLGFGSISSFASVTSNSINFQASNLTDFGLYYGNEFLVNDYFKISSEIFYLNNNLTLATNGDKVFELHQNIGFGLKPAFYAGKHTICLSSGILAVYVFDKDEILGDQLDRFDEAYFIGFGYGFDVTNNIVLNCEFITAKFESISHYTDYTLESFSVLQLKLYYKL